MRKADELRLSRQFRQRLSKMAEQLLERNGVELFGNLTIDVANLDTLALIKRNKIYLNFETRKYPAYVLRYILAHELAHLAVKRHTRRFWYTVRHIYPDYEKGKRELLKRVSQVNGVPRNLDS
jgi:predicted metal-dependent hydrolase